MVATVTPHPAVDWSVSTHANGRMRVKVTCPWCKTWRWDDAATVRHRVKAGTYTGYCYADRLVQRPRRDRLPRLPHPCVDWDDVMTGRTNQGRRLTRVAVTCPTCEEKRYTQPGSTAAKIRRGGFTGVCETCLKRIRWTPLSPGRYLDPTKGYIRLYRQAVPESAMWLFDAMRTNNHMVFEHRFIMAKVLGRPLLTTELVDHMDGVKTNNDPSNLRLYRRGRNEPGETTGYGTFYDEWQRAEARIRELDVSIARLRKLRPKLTPPAQSRTGRR